MQSLLLTFLALFAAVGLGGGGSSSGATNSAKGNDNGNSDQGNGNNSDSGSDSSGGGSNGGGDGSAPTAAGDPIAPTQDVDTSSGGGTDPIDVTSDSYTVAGGRVTTLSVRDSENVDSIRVLDGPDHGNLSVNPDNTLALVMSMEPGFSGNVSMSYEVSYSDGSTEVVNDSVSVAPTTQGAGWGQGNHYMLETDANGDLIVETGENHRAVHISGDSNALSLQDIAALEGISVGQVTEGWLAGHPEYGSSPDLALNEEAGMRLWSGITGTGSAPSSNWLMFERGYEYNNTGNLVDWGTQGEDPLHPIHITSYGSGAKPVINAGVYIFGDDPSENIVFSDLSVTGGITSLSGNNLIFENLDITNDIEGENKMGLFVGGAEGLTLRNSSVTDVYLNNPVNGGSWSNENTSGLLFGANDGVLVEGTLFDHNGWADGYDPGGSGSDGQAPNVFSHNVYIDWDNTDVTFRDNISMRASNNGVMIRSGGHVEDNLIADNNAAGNFSGGNFEGTGQVGNYTLFTDNVITSAGFRESVNTGGLAMGIDNSGVSSTLLDNIIAHLADPNNPQELVAKHSAWYPLNNIREAFYDDTIVYNWGSIQGDPFDPNFDDRNVDGLNTAALDATTIQRFAQQLLGDSNAGIPELADFLRAQAEAGLLDSADTEQIIAFFQTGFGLAPDERSGAETLRFVPDSLADGVRWDNRLNWDTEDLPGHIAGDSVDLGGNYVNYGGTTTIQDLDFGEGGTLNVSHGRLNIEDHTAVGEAGGELNVSSAGQVWMDGYTDRDLLEIDVDGGRFVNTGLFVGRTDIDITDGQFVLGGDGNDFVLRSGSRLEIAGDDARVGFDGASNGTGVMLLDEGSDLVFTAQSGEGLSTIGEFTSGAGDLAGGNVQSGANLGNAELELNVSGLANGTHTLINVNEIIGEFGEIDVNGLGSRNANITIDYANDRVQLQLSSGSGQVSTNVVGNENDAQSNADLWAALTNGHGIYSDDPASSIPDEEDDLDEAA